MHDETPTVAKIEIRKDGFTPSKPWAADIHWTDGTVWKSWAYSFRTLKSLRQHIEAVDSRFKTCWADKVVRA